MKQNLFRYTLLAFSAAAALGGAAIAQGRDAGTLRAGGQAGEQADGFMACVSACDAATRQAVQEINAKRAEAYREVAQRTGVTVEVAAATAAQRLIASLPSGQYYRPAGGGWVRK
jgi:hypothetical protein